MSAKDLREAFRQVSHAAHKVYIRGAKQRAVLSESLHVLHVAVHENACVLEKQEMAASCTCFEWGYGKARCPLPGHREA